MKIATFNVNSVNARLPVLLRWLSESRPDVACLQELKAAQESSLPRRRGRRVCGSITFCSTRRRPIGPLLPAWTERFAGGRRRAITRRPGSNSAMPDRYVPQKVR